ncbi:homeobox protein B-H2 isoform X2 [Anopheles darlingi]|uniref:homeobox protein B-H2 isoform X2 n=1 Tax=Anopheles darlingi TaxID=43151 RepID=UPI0021002864|nr:homeobox protein B-H2 isoform X2 [Anopheles darlingi]
MPGLFPSTIDGHDSGTESDGDLEQEDDLIPEHEMELSLSSRQDTASPSDTACSSESPAFLGPASAAHLLLYDQNSSEEELEVINGGAGAVGNCDIIEVGSVSGVPSRIGTGGPAGLCGRIAAGIDQLPMMSDGADEEDDEEDDATEEIVDDEDDGDEDDEEEDEEVAAAIGSATTATTVTTVTPKMATTIIGSASHRPMDTSVRGHFVSLAAGGANGLGVFADGESLDDFADELCLASPGGDAPMAFNGMLNVKTVSSNDKQQHQQQHHQQQQQRFSTLLEKRKRSLAQNSDDEVRFLLEQQQQTPLHQAHHHHPNHHLHHPHHQHHSMRHQQQQQQQQHLHQQHKQQQLLQQQHQQQQEQLSEESMLSAPVNFRTSPPLEALKPHRGHILQRSTTPLILTESGGHGSSGGGLLLSGSGSGSLLSSTTSSLSSLLSGCGSSASAGGGLSGFYEPGLVGGGSGGIGAGGLRFGLGRRTIGCDSPMTAVSHRNNNGTNQQQQQQHGGISSSSSGTLGSGLSTTTSITNTRTSSSSSSSLSSLSSPSSLAITGGHPCAATGVAESQQRTSAVSAPASSGSSSLVTNMDVSRSVSPPAKMFHCAVSPRRRAPRHQQQRLQRPHRPCLDFDKMQQLKARSVTTWRHSNEHSGELSVFCW